MQVFGAAGLIETMVELAYVVSSREYFNSFEGACVHAREQDTFGLHWERPLSLCLCCCSFVVVSFLFSSNVICPGSKIEPGFLRCAQIE